MINHCLLDKLLDETATFKETMAIFSKQQKTMIYQSVLRDLENLLNTRQYVLKLPPNLSALKNSLFTYGIADFSGTDLASIPAQEIFCQQLASTINSYEPRLKNVEVSLISAEEDSIGLLRLQIEALICVDTLAEPLILHSVIEPSTGKLTLLKTK